MIRYLLILFLVAGVTGFVVNYAEHILESGTSIDRVTSLQNLVISEAEANYRPETPDLRLTSVAYLKKISTDKIFASRNVLEPEIVSLLAKTAVVPPPAEPSLPQVKQFISETVDHQIQAGEDLNSIIDSYTDRPQQVRRILAALAQSEVTADQLLTPEHYLQFTIEETALDEDNTEHYISKLKHLLPTGERLVLRLNQQNEFDHRLRMEQSPEENISKTRTIATTITGSLSATAQRNGIGYSMIDEIVDAFGSNIEFSRDIHAGDSMVLMVQEDEEGEQKLLAASITARGKPYSIVHYKDPSGKEHFINRDGEKIGNYFLRYPVKFSRISSVFDKNRFHPVLKRRKPHNGTDFAAPTGTPVRAAGDGVIQNAAYHRGNGNWIKIKHNGRYQTAYLHLHKLAKGIRPGKRVSRGQLIGYVGSTGLSSGPHLHYSFYDNGQYVDPMKIKLPTIGNESIKYDKNHYAALVELLESSHKNL